MQALSNSNSQRKHNLVQIHKKIYLFLYKMSFESWILIDTSVWCDGAPVPCSRNGGGPLPCGRSPVPCSRNSGGPPPCTRSPVPCSRRSGGPLPCTRSPGPCSRRRRGLGPWSLSRGPLKNVNYFRAFKLIFWSTLFGMLKSKKNNNIYIFDSLKI